ncbi:DsbA family protein [Magnetovibrio sp. PR-2]|uniref:DsbA family protein n=1 Tax=Magnetovibrio sp. PR-2 TaxID=3120356 RepID=UPI002FCDE9F8
MNRRSLVIGVVAAAILGFGGAAFIVSNKTQDASTAEIQNSSQLVRSYSPTFGPKDAPVTIVEFFDPACEACSSFHPYVKQIMEAFPGKIRLVLRYAAFHPPSAEAISILEAARKQNLFEPVLETLYGSQSSWAPHGREATDIWAVVEKTGLNIARARMESQLPDVAKILEQEAADIKAVGVRQTPTFFVNGFPLQQFGPEPLFNLVKRELERSM